MRASTRWVVFFLLLAALLLGGGKAPWADGKKGAGGVITIMTKGKGPRSTYFVDRKGIPTITNRVEAYRGNSDYVEVQIRFEAVRVPDRYRAQGSAWGYVDEDVQYLVRRYSRQYGVNEHLLLAIIKAESDFDRYAVSRKGARGLMQLMPGTWAEMNITDVFDPAQNIAGGTQYFAKLYKLFGRDRALALAAYNAGPGTVKKYGAVPPYRETKNYIKRVENYAKRFARNAIPVRLKTDSERPSDDYLPRVQSPLVVHFANGATQPADKVFDNDPFYVIQFAGRHFTVKRERVKGVYRRS